MPTASRFGKALHLASLLIAPAAASAAVTYHGYNAIRDWQIPGGYTTVVLAMTLLTGAALWFAARAIWLRDPAAQKLNWTFAGLTFVPALLLALLHVQG